jgi:glucose/arabinose dehydrogenase
MGRVFIAEKAGRVKIWKDGVLYARPLIDIRDEVNNFVDRGLIGMALDPNFAQNGWLYLAYAWDAPGEAKDADGPRRGRVVRYTVEGDVARLESAHVVLDDHWSYTQNHSVGTLKFDREGKLWVSLGEGALSAMPGRLALKALSIDNLQGKVLRIDPLTGEGVAGNPFYDPRFPKRARSRVWAYGFSQPLPLRPASGDSAPLRRRRGVEYIRDVDGRHQRGELRLAVRGRQHGSARVPRRAGVPRCEHPHDNAEGAKLSSRGQ